MAHGSKKIWKEIKKYFKPKNTVYFKVREKQCWEKIYSIKCLDYKKRRKRENQQSKFPSQKGEKLKPKMSGGK